MPAYIKNTGGTWSNSISAFYIKSTTWRTVSAGYIKVAGTWASFFTSVLTPSIQSTVTISRNNAEYPSTLTGTNFYWTNSTSLTYVFQKSSDNVTFTNIGSATSIANPSPSSSNTVTYVLTLADMPSVLSYYRFVVTASNSTYSTSATSTSSSVSVISRPSGGTVSLSPTGTQYDGTTLTASTTGWSGSPSSYSVRIYASMSNPPTTSGILKASSAGASSVTYQITTLDATAPAYYFKAFATATNAYSVTSTEEPGSNVVTSALTAPSPPTITSSSSTTTSITLNFTLGANSTSTRAYLNGGFDGSTSSTSYTFSSLSPGTAYTLALYGYNGVTQSSSSSGGTYSTSTGAALTPTFGSNTSTSGGFTGSVTNYSASYTWGISTNSGSVSFGSPSGSTYPFTVSGLSSGASATVTVTTSRTGYSGGSATTTGTASVSVPSGGTVSLSPSGSQYEGVTLTASTTGWSGSPTSYSVRIYASSSNPPNTGGILRASSSSSSVTYTITQSDAAAPAYYFKAFATATNSGGTSSEEPGSNVVLSVAKTVPGLVTSFTATSSLSGSNLNWSASWSAPSSDGGASITGYKVYVERSSSSSGPWTATATQIPAGSGAYTAASPYSTSSQSVTGRVTSTSSTWIRVWVAAVNSVGTGTYTSAVG